MVPFFLYNNLKKVTFGDVVLRQLSHHLFTKMYFKSPLLWGQNEADVDTEHGCQAGNKV